ncbi:hypothetical protein [Paenibacillus polymyxa]|uniref:KOW domain-containing protein n=1 Tax=Paenibacillus polymyxa (strain SC2) TaxID=886882 RepID=E3EJZ3_PAEPS|nr:hypothetical protein [Paenibacillus polymyxa]ADO60012.1 hypothetical protein PPSC2_28125 [Paenibacillus polymyxa SC2]WPQ59771.1 hypothetical protein SKN87_26135 [Paenibacillus polymyxa]
MDGESPINIINEEDKVRIVDGCFEGKVGTVRVVRTDKHYPYLVTLPDHELLPFLEGQIKKI